MGRKEDGQVPPLSRSRGSSFRKRPSTHYIDRSRLPNVTFDVCHVRSDPGSGRHTPQSACRFWAMCGRIWTPPDCNRLAGLGCWSQLLTYIRLRDAAGQRLRREPRWVFARFHLNGSQTSSIDVRDSTAPRGRGPYHWLRVGKKNLHFTTLVGAAMCSAFSAVRMTAGHNVLRSARTACWVS